MYKSEDYIRLPWNWLIEKPDIARRDRVDAWLERRASLVRLSWRLIRPPLVLLGCLGYWFAAPLFMPLFTLMLGGWFASRPPGLGFHIFVIVALSFWTFIALASAWTFLVKIRKQVFSPDDLFIAFSTLLSVALGGYGYAHGYIP